MKKNTYFILVFSLFTISIYPLQAASEKNKKKLTHADNRNVQKAPQKSTPAKDLQKHLANTSTSNKPSLADSSSKKSTPTSYLSDDDDSSADSDSDLSADHNINNSAKQALISNKEKSTSSQLSSDSDSDINADLNTKNKNKPKTNYNYFDTPAGREAKLSWELEILRGSASNDAISNFSSMNQNSLNQSNSPSIIQPATTKDSSLEIIHNSRFFSKNALNSQASFLPPNKTKDITASLPSLHPRTKTCKNKCKKPLSVCNSVNKKITKRSNKRPKISQNPIIRCFSKTSNSSTRITGTKRHRSPSSSDTSNGFQTPPKKRRRKIQNNLSNQHDASSNSNPPVVARIPILGLQASNYKIDEEVIIKKETDRNNTYPAQTGIPSQSLSTLTLPRFMSPHNSQRMNESIRTNLGQNQLIDRPPINASNFSNQIAIHNMQPTTPPSPILFQAVASQSLMIQPTNHSSTSPSKHITAHSTSSSSPHAITIKKECGNNNNIPTSHSNPTKCTNHQKTNQIQCININSLNSGARSMQLANSSIVSPISPQTNQVTKITRPLQPCNISNAVGQMQYGGYNANHMPSKPFIPNNILSPNRHRQQTPNLYMSMQQNLQNNQYSGHYNATNPHNMNRTTPIDSPCIINAQHNNLMLQGNNGHYRRNDGYARNVYRNLTTISPQQIPQYINSTGMRPVCVPNSGANYAQNNHSNQGLSIHPGVGVNNMNNRQQANLVNVSTSPDNQNSKLWLLFNEGQGRRFISRMPNCFRDAVLKLQRNSIPSGCSLDAEDDKGEKCFIKKESPGNYTLTSSLNPWNTGQQQDARIGFVPPEDILGGIKNHNIVVFYPKDPKEDDSQSAVLGKGFSPKEKAKLRRSYNYVFDLDQLGTVIKNKIEKNPNEHICSVTIPSILLGFVVGSLSK